MVPLSPFLTSGQQVIEMAAPPGRVLARAQPLSSGSVKNSLDPAPEPGGSHMLALPYRGKDLQNVGRLDCFNRHVA